MSRRPSSFDDSRNQDHNDESADIVPFPMRHSSDGGRSPESAFSMRTRARGRSLRTRLLMRSTEDNLNHSDDFTDRSKDIPIGKLLRY